MEPVSRPRLYNIQHEPGSFHTGHVKNGNQILISVQLPEIVMVEFDADGNYLRVATREIPKQYLSVVNDRLRVDDYVLSALIENWRDEIGLIPGTISVKQFFLPERWICIRDLPDHYQEVLDNPEDYDDEELQNLREDIRQWLAHGDFVLYLDRDYYLSSEGEVEST
jgi:hypothetical protein